MLSKSSAAGTVSKECASGLEHRFKPGVHFFFFDKLPAPGCRESFFHGGKEAGFLVEITGHNIRHQPLREGSSSGGDLRKLGLLFDGEIDFPSPTILKNLR